MILRPLLAGCVLVVACKSAPEPAPTPTRPPQDQPAPHLQPVAAPTNGVDRAGMDPATRPGDDFFKYANGRWLAATEIPADQASWSTGSELTDRTAKRIVALIQEAASGASGGDGKKVGDYYATFMDEAAIEAKGLSPLQPTLDSIARLDDRAALARYLGSTLRADVDVLNNTNLHTDNVFGLWVAQDLSDPTKYSPFLLQGGLGMPDRDYYLDPSAPMVAIREAYEAHVAAVLELAKVGDAKRKAKAVVELEHALAAGHATRTESEDVVKGNTHWARGEFTKRAPGLDWKTWFAAAGLDHTPEVTVWQPAAIAKISALIGKTPLATWRDYLTVHAIDHFAPVLPAAFVAENFHFFDTVLTGTPQLRERWKRAVEHTSAALGEAVGKLYVERYFPASEKARVEAMVANEIAAFGARIDRLAWMAPATKLKAKAKLAALRVSVGYPDKWRDYSGLEVVRGDALGNAQRADQFERARNLAKLGQPVNRGEWVMNPQLVNAVNLPAMNALNFPAAILQPPNSDPTRPVVLDYGATGSTIGHEISHSFDDEGAMFDATGKLENWWTAEDFAHFKASSQALAAQYDTYKPFPDLAIHGEQTLSENIADVAGLAVAFDAYHLAYGGKPAPTVDGLTGNQQFFIAFAQKWRSKYRDAELRHRVLTDGHAPAPYRADTARNLDDWYTAFEVHPGEALYLPPAERVRIW